MIWDTSSNAFQITLYGDQEEQYDKTTNKMTLYRSTIACSSKNNSKNKQDVKIRKFQRQKTKIE